ncbi:hypothetical protein MASR2M78_01950 [Treponema sp.]
MVFNLQWNVRHAGTINGTGPVQLKMMLGKVKYKVLKASGELISEKESFISFHIGHAMRASVAWFAIEMT